MSKFSKPTQQSQSFKYTAYLDGEAFDVIQTSTKIHLGSKLIAHKKDGKY